MKRFSIRLGGQERPVRYTPGDGIQLYKEFGRPLEPLIREDVLGGFDEGGEPRNEFRPDVQAVFLRLGLSHDAPRLTEKGLLDWIEEFLEAGGNMWELVWPAAKAAYYSGIVLGRSVDLEERARLAAEGKGEPTPPSPPAAIPAAE
jgi:hypothetical protein